MPVVVVGAGAILFALERAWSFRADWRREERLGVDLFFVIGNFVVTAPVLLVLWESPLTDGLSAVRASVFDVAWFAGLPVIVRVALVYLVAELVGWTLHRAMHENALLWRLHGMHHHLTSLTFLKGFVNHPLEYLVLLLNGVVAVAVFGASDHVKDAYLVLVGVQVMTVHANLPLTSPLFSLLFTTPAHHRVHHSVQRDAQDTNFGCTFILYDRLFGTYGEDAPIGAAGNGDGRRLALRELLAFPFRSPR
jgi:sterol desaturase/sphingolipid hydroxylase (fatty acid hydroxylase superfamily)